MKSITRFVGLDVHMRSVVVAVAEAAGGEAQVLARLPGEDAAVLKTLRKLGPPGTLQVCYEAGPTGYGLCRLLRKEGYDCEVVAPSLVPMQVGNRIKTDRRDALRLAHFLRSGDLTSVHVPELEAEAMRDLERAREDAKKAERVARHQLDKFALRHGHRFEGKKRWTAVHLDWMRSLPFDHEAQRRVLVDYVHEVELAAARVDRLTKDIEELAKEWAQAPLVRALQALRGVRLLTAVILVAEIGDFRRFDNAPAFMSFLGLVPTENSTGDSRRQGGITKSGNGHVRRALVESAWSYRFSPKMSPTLRARNDGLALGVQEIAWKAQQRLHKRYRAMLLRGKDKQRTVTAIARELAGFIWAIGHEEKLLAA